MKLDLPSAPLAEVDPEFEKVGIETGELAFALTGTSLREKLLQNLTQDVCRSQLGLPFRMHVMAAAMHGFGYADLLGAIRFMAPYAGYPAAADALSHLKQIAGEIGLATDEVVDTPSTAGEPPEIMATSDEWMLEFMRSRTSRAWSETCLSTREKAIIAVTSDVSAQTLGESFRHHIKLALDAGVTPEQLRDAVRFCAEHGLGRTVAALRELDSVLAEY